MRRDAGSVALVIALMGLGCLTFGCGGGGVNSNAQINQQNAQTTGSTTPQALESPMLGYAYAAGGTEVRAINGVTGASSQGPAIGLPAGVTAVNFAPTQKSAIVEVSGGPVGAISFQAAEPGPVVTISGAISQPDIIAFSPTGVAAALYSSSEGHLQVVTGLTGSPVVARDLTTAQIAASPQALAIADDGATLLEGTTDGGIYLLSANGPQLLETVSALGAMAFTPKTTNALIFDRGAGALTLMESVSVLHSSQSLAAGLTGLDGVVFLASDGRNALVSGANATNVWEVNLQTLQMQTLALQTPAIMLTPLRASGDYLLSWQPGGLAWIVDTNQPKGAVYLVPAATTAQAALVR
jgi:hypothetical protein